MSETGHDPLVGYYRDEAGRWVIADAGDHFPALVDDRTATLLDALAIARQSLADVAYLEVWIHAPDTDRGLVTVYESKPDGEEKAWEAHDWTLSRTERQPTLPALGALLRQREGGR